MRMVGQSFEDSNYAPFIAKGDLTKGAVYQKWEEIWSADLSRSFAADFEVYGEKAQDPLDAEVEIFVSLVG